MIPKFQGHFSLYGTPATVAKAKEKLINAALQQSGYGAVLDEKEFGQAQNLALKSDDDTGFELRQFWTGSDALRKLFHEPLRQLRWLYERHQAGDISDSEYLEQNHRQRAQLPPELVHTTLFEQSPNRWSMYSADELLERFEQFDLESGKFNPPA